MGDRSNTDISPEDGRVEDSSNHIDNSRPENTQRLIGDQVNIDSDSPNSKILETSDDSSTYANHPQTDGQGDEFLKTPKSQDIELTVESNPLDFSVSTINSEISDSINSQQEVSSLPFAEYIYNVGDKSSYCEELIYSSSTQYRRKDMGNTECSKLMEKAREMSGNQEIPLKWFRTNDSGFKDSVKEFLSSGREDINSFTYENFSRGKEINGHNCFSSQGDDSEELIVSCFGISPDSEEEDLRTYEEVNFTEEDRRFNLQEN
ncbi:hypothetical protein [Mycoplasma suis]|uniref:Uncharacterized protein n=1 Tax=Mycoplasma suis (strain Illinois) TaxID=768700 RepID=F0QQK8_MYCSL|nr:hypothetical protein [Mycoplasma suis]ADX97778.1 hypothetical protein MSU_0234 [Mycoplasma suis str. Illinois]